MKILYTKNKKNKKYLIKDTEKDYHSQYGLIKSEDIKKSNPGDVLTSNINEKFTILDAGFLDKYFKIKRGPQIIPLKDIGSIITMTGINKNSIVLEAGGGSGGLTCILGHLCKKVYSYDIRDDFQEIVKKNIEFLGLKNVKIKKGSIYENIKEREIDMISLDCPEPWKAINTVNDALKIGGYIVSYSPTIIQTADMVNNMIDNFLHLKTIEIIEREWEVIDRKVRPKSVGIGHSGFLSFFRKLS